MIQPLKFAASSLNIELIKGNRLRLSFIASSALILFLVCACSDDDASQAGNSVNELICKSKPAKIAFGNDTNDFVYDTNGNPTELTTTIYNQDNISSPPIISVYKIAYNANGKADKVSKFVNTELTRYYNLDYNGNGQLTKQSEFDGQGNLEAYTTALYDTNSALSSITSHSANTGEEVTTVYDYLNGILIKKSVQNLYDSDSQEFYNADFTYSYFVEKDNKINSYFQGPLGLIFISNASNQPSLQYLYDSNSYQLFYAQETSFERKMLKNIQIIAHRYGTRDTTNVDYSYEYDSTGYPTLQRGLYKNVTRRYVPTPFGGTVLLVTPNNKSFEKSINFSCN